MTGVPSDESDTELEPIKIDTMAEIEDETLQELLMWVDQVPLSRPKRNIARDFADGVLVAEIVKHFFPRLVELHNYTPASSTKQRLANWAVLNRKVFRKLRFEITDDLVRQIVACKPWVIEHVLLMLRSRLNRLVNREQRRDNSSSFFSDQNSPISSKSKEGARRSRIPVHHQPVSLQPQGLYDNMMINNNASSNYHPNDLRQEMVPRIVLEEKEQEVLQNEEKIQLLQAKVRRLEHLVHLKDIRIEDLRTQLDQTSFRTDNGSNPKRDLMRKRIY